MEVRELTCLVCPVGCRARVYVEGGRAVRWENLECRAGEEYVRKEVELPLRDFFTVVRVKGGGVVPVRSTGPISKDRLLEASRELAGLEVEGPIRVGEVLVKGLLGMGVDVVATGEAGG
jgi:CxxC motif-containing protein